MLEQVRFAFIGGGNMAEALIKGLLSGLGVKPQQIMATDVVPERRTYMQTTAASLAFLAFLAALSDCDCAVLC